MTFQGTSHQNVRRDADPSRESLISTMSERLTVVMDTTREIKEQLTIMNGRVRQNELSIAVIQANPPLTREHCDQKHSPLEERIRQLEGRLPPIIQSIVVALLTGGALGLVSYFLSKIP